MSADKSLIQKPAIAEIIEILGTKWVMRIIWELRGDNLTFRTLQRACGDISPTVLNKRLHLLEEHIIIQKLTPNGYQLTELGQTLLDLYEPLNDWAKTWRIQKTKL